MVRSTIIFVHPSTGQLRAAPVGFSWVTLFFRFIPALIRRDWRGAFVMAALMVLTLDASSLIFPFFYNRMYIRSLIRQGYVVGGATRDIQQLSRRLRLHLPTDDAIPVLVRG